MKNIFLTLAIFSILFSPFEFAINDGIYLKRHLAYAALDTNLVSYWKLDESSGNASDSVGSNTLTNNNTVTYGAGWINNEASFVAASSQSLSISDASQSGLEPTGAFTACASHKTGTGENGILFGKWKDGSLGNGSWEVRFDNGGNAINFYINDAIADALNEAPTLNDNTRYYVCVTFDGSAQRMIVYLDGTALSAGLSTTGTSVQNGNASFRVAANNNSSDTATNFLDGTVDEYGFWSRALTATEILTLYNAGAGCQYPFSTCATGGVIRQSIFEDE